MLQFNRRAPLYVLVGILYVFVVGKSAVWCVDPHSMIPASIEQVNPWFVNLVTPHTMRRGTIDPSLEAAEDRVKVIRVRKDGQGDFSTITDAVNSLPAGNSQRVIVWIGGGVYKEKVTVPRTTPFVTFYVSPNEEATLTFDGNAAKYGTVNSATLIVESDYFMAYNLIIENASPKPTQKMAGAQAVALRLSGDKAALYNCRLLGFQDTLCDDRGFHLFKDCYIQGTVDFIFGSGTSIYLNNELRVLGDGDMTMITAQARQSPLEDTGYSIVHSKVTGTGSGTVLGRAWMPCPRVIYSYTYMSEIINPLGWSDNFHPERDSTVYYGEYQNYGPGSNLAGRAKFTKVLSYDEVYPFLSLDYIVGLRWLLPPPRL